MDLHEKTAYKWCSARGRRDSRRLAGIALSLWAWTLLGQQSPPAPEKLEIVRSSITVAEKISAEAPASIAVLEARQLQQVPGVNIDVIFTLIYNFELCLLLLRYTVEL